MDRQTETDSWQLDLSEGHSMTMQYAGTMSRDRRRKPLMDREDSSIKKAMKSVMKLTRANMPKMPTPMKKAEGM